MLLNFGLKITMLNFQTNGLQGVKKYRRDSPHTRLGAAYLILRNYYFQCYGPEPRVRATQLGWRNECLLIGVAGSFNYDF